MGMKIGQCRLCGEIRALSFEHVPPRRAFNDQPVLIQQHKHLFGDNPYLLGKSSRSQRGLGEYSLCECCQKNTGDWYARHYVAFAHQLACNIVNPSNGSLTFMINPYRVFKQCLVLFASAERSGYLLRKPEYRKYLLDPHCTIRPTDVRLYFYCTTSNTGRFNGWSAQASISEPSIIQCAEIAFAPIGLVMSFSQRVPNPWLTDITHFSEYADSNQQISIPAHRLALSGPISLHYDAVYDLRGNLRHQFKSEGQRW